MEVSVRLASSARPFLLVLSFRLPAYLDPYLAEQVLHFLVTVGLEIRALDVLAADGRPWSDIRSGPTINTSLMSPI